MFETQRLVLRPFRESDLSSIADLWNDPLVQRGLNTGLVAPKGPKFADQIREWVASGVIYVIIEGKETHEFMGTCNIWMLNAKNRDGMMAIALLPKFWNNGYGTETLKFIVDYAFRWLALHRVSLSVFEGNKGAIASYKKIGFVVEGVKRKANWADGAWEDIYDMNMLDEEWAATHWKKT